MATIFAIDCIPSYKQQNIHKMMVKSVRSLLIAMITLCGKIVLAQNLSTMDQTLVNLQKQAGDFPFEKVYLHTDKPFYGAGDTIWFKGYLVAGAQHHLSGISYVLNVDLINEKGDIKKSIKLPVVNGLTFGDISLADTIPEGNYRLRAYTNWMRNFGSEYFFDNTFRIVNAVSNKVFTQSDYTYSLLNNQQTVNATISYSDIDGKPYVGKTVKYQVDLNARQVVKGTGVTDEKGNLKLGFTNPASGLLNTGQINTQIQLDDQRLVNKTIAIKATSPTVDLQFFPESGNLVNGVTSKVAFKATGADGLGVDIKGAITDEQGNKVAEFGRTHFGMGAFLFTPQSGKKYTANMVYPDGQKNTTNFPQPQDKGFVLSINNTDTLNNIIVVVSGSNVGNAEVDGVTLVAQSGGEIYFEGKSRPGQTNFTAIVPKKKFPTGIVQFTLFNTFTGEPLNERLVFVQNPDEINLAITSPKATYAPREKVKLNLNAKNADGLPVQGDFSVSVTDETFVPANEATESTILSNILLREDIKGYIEQPNYYFSNTSAQKVADLDVLMLTQGYHRFEWKPLMANVQPVILFKPEKSIAISGLVKTLGGKPVIKGKVSLFSTSDGLFLLDTVTDKNGRFNFDMAFVDSSKFTVRALKPNGNENVDLELDNIPPPIKSNKNTSDAVVSLNKGLESFLKNSRNRYEADQKYGVGDHTIMLQEININKARPKSEHQLEVERAVQYSDNLNGKGEADQVVTTEDIEQYGGATLYDVLNGRLAGVEFRRDSNGNLQPYSIRSSNQLNSAPQPMAIIIDGIFGRDITLLPISQIASIEVLRSMNYLAAYGSRASNGILIVTTKHGGQELTPPVSVAGSIEYKPKGYYKARQFYTPKYDMPNVDSKIPDLRTTVYWKPLIETDKDGNAVIEFYNADGIGSYRVVIEGIDYKTGSLGRRVYNYVVK